MKAGEEDGSSFYFFRDYERVPDRLDCNYSNPKYDMILSLIARARFPIAVLGESQEKLDTSYLRSITSGKTPKGIRYIESEGVPFLGATSVYEGRVHIGEAPFISPIVHETILHGSMVKKDDVLITMAGHYIGRCAVQESSQECNANQALAILRANTDNVLPAFLAGYLNSTLGQLFFGRLQHLAGQPNINLEEIVTIPIIMPPRVAQQAIVDEINEIRNEITPLDRLIQKAFDESDLTLIEELGMTVSDTPSLSPEQTYFFKTGFDNNSPFFAQDFDSNALSRLSFHFNDQENVSVISRLKKQYSTTTLNAIYTVRRGEQPEYLEEGSQEDGVIAIKTVDLKDNRIAYESCLKVSQTFFDSHPDAHAKKNDVLVTSTGYISMGKVDTFDSEEEAFVDGHVSILRLREGVEYDPYFLTYFMRSPFGKAQFERFWTGSSGQIELQIDDLKSFTVPDNTEDGVPLTRQRTIAERITTQLSSVEKFRNEKKRLADMAIMKFDEAIFSHEQDRG